MQSVTSFKAGKTSGRTSDESEREQERHDAGEPVEVLRLLPGDVDVLERRGEEGLSAGRGCNDDRPGRTIPQRPVTKFIGLVKEIKVSERKVDRDDGKTHIRIVPSAVILERTSLV